MATLGYGKDKYGVVGFLLTIPSAKKEKARNARFHSLAGAMLYLNEVVSYDRGGDLSPMLKIDQSVRDGQRAAESLCRALRGVVGHQNIAEN
jgi:hypothetical protein